MFERTGARGAAIHLANLLRRCQSVTISRHDERRCMDRRGERTIQIPGRVHAMHTDSGQPSSCIRFRAQSVVATSGAR